MQLFVSWSLSVYTLNQVARFMQSLFTNCSRQKKENPDNEDIIIPVCILLIAAGIQQYRGNHFGRLWVRPWIARRNQYGTYHALVQELSSEDRSGLKKFLRMTKWHHYFFSLSSHVLFTMWWPCAFICWWCCNLLTSNQDLCIYVVWL
jgi:hypothetical protein